MCWKWYWFYSLKLSYLLNRRLVGLQSWSGSFEEEKSILSCRESNPDLPGRSLVAILTSLALGIARCSQRAICSVFPPFLEAMFRDHMMTAVWKFLRKVERHLALLLLYYKLCKAWHWHSSLCRNPGEKKFSSSKAGEIFALKCHST